MYTTINKNIMRDIIEIANKLEGREINLDINRHTMCLLRGE